MARLGPLTLVLLLAVAAAAPRKKDNGVPRTELAHRCLRNISRAVRKQLEKEILRPLKRRGPQGIIDWEWPNGCPLDPARDLFGYQEKQKQRQKPGSAATTWTCGICGKQFNDEHYLDLHMERKHVNETPAEGVCLADYCELFEVCFGEEKWRRHFTKAPICSNATMKTHQRRCEDGLRACFPLGNGTTRNFYGKWSRALCSGIDCRIREEKKKEHEGAFIPVIVLLIVVVLAGFIAFAVVLCCVDFGEDILEWMMDVGLASVDWVKSFRRCRDTVKKEVGLQQDHAKAS